jgi:hypothetical protein
MVKAADEQTASVDFFGIDRETVPFELKVVPNTIVRLPFVWSVPNDTLRRLSIVISPFRNKAHGDSITVRPLDDEGIGPAANEPLDLYLSSANMDLILSVPYLPNTGSYEGYISIYHRNQLIKTIALSLNRASAVRTVKLSTDRPQYTVNMSTWPGLESSREEENIAFLVRNMDSYETARGVYLTLTEFTGGNFVPEQNLRLSWNGALVENIWWSEAEPEEGVPRRDILPNSQVIIGGAFRLLPAGEYSMKLGIASTNSDLDNKPEITVDLKVRHNVLYAASVLLIALFLSFLANVGLNTQRNRLSLLEKINNCRKPWLRELPAISSVVAVRAMLRQAQDRNTSWWKAVFTTDAIGRRVDKVSILLNPLRHYRDIRRQLNNWNQDAMVVRRAKKKLRGIMGEIDPDNLNESLASEIVTKLKELQAWMTSNNLDELYWLDLKQDVDTLNTRMAPGDFTDDAVRNIVSSLMGDLKNACVAQEGLTGGEKLKNAIEIESIYSKLKIFNERNQDGDTDTLLKLAKELDRNAKMSIPEFFERVDNIAWNRIKQACEYSKGVGVEMEATGGNDKKLGMYFKSPRHSSINPLRAYQLIEFEVAPEDPMLGNNFLFKHGLKYHWKLEIKREKPEVKTDKDDFETLSEEISEVPRIIQYVPEKCQLRVSVVLKRRSDSSAGVNMRDPLMIESSNDVGPRSTLQSTEWAALSISALFALVSGLGTLYYAVPAFGSPEHYIALFLWGAGVDQTKNLIQNYSQVSKPA